MGEPAVEVLVIADGVLPRMGSLCPKLVMAVGAMALTPDGVVLVAEVGVLPRGVPEIGSLCPEVVTAEGVLALTPDGVVLVAEVGVLTRGVPDMGSLCPEVLTADGVLALVPNEVVALGAVVGVKARIIPDGVESLGDELATTVVELVLTAAGILPAALVGVGVRGTANLGPEVATTLGELVGTLTRTVPGVTDLNPEVDTVADEPADETPAVCMPALGVPEGLASLCTLLLTGLGVLPLGVEEVADLVPSPEVVIAVGVLVLIPEEGLGNLGAVTVDGVLIRGVWSL